MTSNSAIRMIETNSNVKEGSQDSLTQKNIVRTCLQVHIHGEWMLPSLMRSFVRQSSIRELCTLAFHELTVDLLLPVCYNRIHTHIAHRCAATGHVAGSCSSRRLPRCRFPVEARGAQIEGQMMQEIQFPYQGAFSQ